MTGIRLLYYMSHYCMIDKVFGLGKQLRLAPLATVK